MNDDFFFPYPRLKFHLRQVMVIERKGGMPSPACHGTEGESWGDWREACSQNGNHPIFAEKSSREKKDREKNKLKGFGASTFFSALPQHSLWLL